jgi:hypothetical protein
MKIEDAKHLQPGDRIEVRLESCPKLVQKATVLPNPPAPGKRVVSPWETALWVAIDTSCEAKDFGYVTIQPREILKKLGAPLRPPIKDTK